MLPRRRECGIVLDGKKYCNFSVYIYREFIVLDVSVYDAQGLQDCSLAIVVIVIKWASVFEVKLRYCDFQRIIFY